MYFFCCVFSLNLSKYQWMKFRDLCRWHTIPNKFQENIWLWLLVVIAGGDCRWLRKVIVAVRYTFSCTCPGCAFLSLSYPLCSNKFSLGLKGEVLVKFSPGLQGEFWSSFTGASRISSGQVSPGLQGEALVKFSPGLKGEFWSSFYLGFKERFWSSSHWGFEEKL